MSGMIPLLILANIDAKVICIVSSGDGLNFGTGCVIRLKLRERRWEWCWWAVNAVTLELR
jgi:hypothetical protein